MTRLSTSDAAGLPPESKATRSRFVSPGLALILALSGFLNLYNSSFPLGYHSDEVKKVRFVKEGTQDFLHPILLLQATRLAVALTGCDDDQEIVVAGRTVSAIAGAVIVAITFAIAADLLGASLGLICALAVACVPLIVIHAHYLKEDLLFTSMALLSVWSLLRFLESPDWRRLVALGIATGLAFSAQYKGFLLLVLFALMPLVANVGGLLTYIRRVGAALCIASCVFLTVNYPLLFDAHKFLTGVRYESKHALTGHDIVIRAGDFYGGFHLLHSLLPGCGPILLMLSLAGLTTTIVMWRSENWRWRALALYVGLFYFTAEFSPLKPFPDFARYMIAATPILLCFVGRLAEWARGLRVRSARFAVTAAAVVGIALAGGDALLLDYYLTRDTRAEAQRVIAELGARPIYERHASLTFEDTSLAQYSAQELCLKTATHAVCSSFQYERFFFAEKLPGQRPVIGELRESYQRLFDRPHIIIEPEYRSYGLSNPTIRIIPVCDSSSK